MTETTTPPPASQARLLYELTPPTGSPEWHALRRTGIGGSDIAPFAGLSPFKSPLEIWMEKTGRLEPEDLSANARVRWGTRLEDTIAAGAAEDFGITLHRVNQTVRRGNAPWMMAHIDRRVVGVHEGAEIKAVALDQLTRGEWGESGTDKVPTAYYLQCLWYMAVLGWEAWNLYALFGGNDLRAYRIERDEEAIAQVIELGERAWSWVTSNTEPPIQTIADAKRKFPRSVEMLAIANQEILDVDTALRAVDDELEAVEERRDKLRASIMAYMGDADTLVMPDGKTRLRTWKTQEKKAYSVAASSARVFREVALK